MKPLKKISLTQPISLFCFSWVEFCGLLIFYFVRGKSVSIHKDYLKKPIISLFIIVIYSFICFHILGYDNSKLIQQSIILLVYVFLYSIYFSYVNRNLKDLFVKYIKVSYFVSLLGLLQVFIYFFFSLDIFSSFSWLTYTQKISENVLRLHSICPEAGQLGTILSPVLVYLWYFDDCWNIMGKKKWIIYSAILLTSAMTAIVVFVLICYFKYISKGIKVDIITIVVIFVLGTSLLGYVNTLDRIETGNSDFYGVIMRIQDMFQIVTNIDDLEQIEKTNSSTYAWTSNFYVARHAPIRLTGTGLGSHQQNYHMVYKDSSSSFYGLNDEEGYSLFNRILSEFGYLGLCLYLFFIFRHLDRRDVISFSLLFYIISAMMRGGNYFIAGVFFFHYFYIISRERFYYGKNICNNSNI